MCICYEYMHVVTTDEKKPYILKRVWGCIQKDLEEEKKRINAVNILQSQGHWKSDL